MKLSTLNALLSLTSASLAAPRHSNVKRQPTGDDNLIAKATLPIVLRQSSGDTNGDNTDGRVKTIIEWRDHITAINSFIDSAEALLDGALAGRDYSLIVDGVQRTREEARQEPALVKTLHDLAGDGDLTAEAEAAVDTLTFELQDKNGDGFGLSRIFDEMQGGAQITPVAQTQEELDLLPGFARQLQPDCAVADQLKELVGIRCCILSPALSTFWRAVIFGPGLGLEVDTDIPKPRACDRPDVCTPTDGCGPPESTVGYRFLKERDLDFGTVAAIRI